MELATPIQRIGATRIAGFMPVMPEQPGSGMGLALPYASRRRDRLGLPTPKHARVSRSTPGITKRPPSSVRGCVMLRASEALLVAPEHARPCSLLGDGYSGVEYGGHPNSAAPLLPRSPIGRLIPGHPRGTKNTWRVITFCGESPYVPL